MKKRDGVGLPPALQEHLERLASEGFFGVVQISFQAGKVTQVREERVLKVDELGRERGS